MQGPNNKHEIDIDQFGFFNREKRDGKTVIYRCGRDFFFYTLHFFYPERYNREACDALKLERSGQLGWRFPWWLMWTLLQFSKTPELLEREGLKLTINGRHIRSWFGFLASFLIPKPPSYEAVIVAIDEAIKNNEVIGIDVSLKYAGLLDHILFVYGYDEDGAVYVFDTHQVPYLNYNKVTSDDRYIMRISKEEVIKRLGLFSRIWRVSRLR